VTPVGVAFPKTPAEVTEVVDVCRCAGIAVTARGGGTSMAGNAIGDGVVIDSSRYMNRIVSIDPHARTAMVEPGIVVSELAAAVERAPRVG
jgi:FAD/FMN-containing dehydrogenase